MNDMYSLVRQSLAPFRNWIDPFVSKEELVANGFVYTGKRDIVKCRFCKVKLEGWKNGDIAYERHKEVSPSCIYVVDERSNWILRFYCCELKCMVDPQVYVDGIACAECRSYNYCHCTCKTYWKKKCEWLKSLITKKSEELGDLQAKLEEVKLEYGLKPLVIDESSITYFANEAKRLTILRIQQMAEKIYLQHKINSYDLTRTPMSLHGDYI